MGDVDLGSRHPFSLFEYNENISPAIADGTGMLLGARLFAWMHAVDRTGDRSELVPEVPDWDL